MYDKFVLRDAVNKQIKLTCNVVINSIYYFSLSDLFTYFTEITAT